MVTETEPFLSLIGRADVRPVAGAPLLATRSRVIAGRMWGSGRRRWLRGLGAALAAFVAVPAGYAIYPELGLVFGLAAIVAFNFAVNLVAWYRAPRPK
jgi:hypothetical protein